MSQCPVPDFLSAGKRGEGDEEPSDLRSVTSHALVVAELLFFTTGIRREPQAAGATR
jgi:hypothetical protein